MLPINSKAAKEIKKESITLRFSCEMHFNQSQYSTGILAKSENNRSIRINHPEPPNVKTHAAEQAPTRNALPKARSKTAAGQEIKTAKAVIKKGKKRTVNRPTIDTWQEAAWRIKETKESEQLANIKPQNMPIKNNAGITFLHTGSDSKPRVVDTTLYTANTPLS
jgi:hypothetical protein